MRHDAPWPWSELGLGAPTDLRGIKRAYAARLKQIDRNNPHVFQALQYAFDGAKRAAVPDQIPARPSVFDLLQGNPGSEAEPVAPTAFDALPDAVPGDATHPQEDLKSLIADATPPEREKAEIDAQEERLARVAWETTSQYEMQWWSQFDAAVQWPWDVQALDRLLSQQFALENPNLRPQAEKTLFLSLGDNLNQKKMRFEPTLAKLLENHFQWSVDSVGLERRVGRLIDSPAVMHAYLQSLPSTKRSRYTNAEIAFHSTKPCLLLLSYFHTVMSAPAFFEANMPVVKLFITSFIMTFGLFFLIFFIVYLIFSVPTYLIFKSVNALINRGIVQFELKSFTRLLSVFRWFSTFILYNYIIKIAI
jgi:hypothetical protein